MTQRIKSLDYLLTVDFNENDINSQRRFRRSVKRVLDSLARRLNGFGATDENQGTVLLGSDGILRLWDRGTETYRRIELDNGTFIVVED